MKRSLLTALAVCLSLCSLHALPRIVIVDEPAVTHKPITYAEWIKSGGTRPSGPPSKSFAAPLLGTDGILVSSVCTINSSYVTQSRANAMAGLTGVIVPMNPTTNPGAWNVLNANNFQWWNALLTEEIHSWIGRANPSNAATMNEFGNNLAIHCWGKYPVSAYFGTVASTLTNVTPAWYAVGTNSAGTEIAFNVNFPGINRGQNGIMESFYDPTRGLWVQGGDDTIYTNGELPSQVNYDCWLRFGARFYIDCKTEVDWDLIKMQFMWGSQTFTAGLLKGGPSGTVVASETLSEPSPKVNVVHPGPNSVNFWISNGQDGLPYILETTTSFNPAVWTRYSGQLFLAGTQYPVVMDAPAKFLRVRIGSN